MCRQYGLDPLTRAERCVLWLSVLVSAVLVVLGFVLCAGWTMDVAADVARETSGPVHPQSHASDYQVYEIDSPP